MDLVNPLAKGRRGGAIRVYRSRSCDVNGVPPSDWLLSLSTRCNRTCSIFPCSDTSKPMAYTLTKDLSRTPCCKLELDHDYGVAEAPVAEYWFVLPTRFAAIYVTGHGSRLT
eukprot:9468064-Pyramimonas_sp.AAC.2